MLSSGPRAIHAGVEETRGRILGAARELFERHGTRGTTTREVAERAGVNEATLFRHFGSKRALLDAMREHGSDADALRVALAGLSGEDPRADLLEVGRLAAEAMVARRGMICVALAEEAGCSDEQPEWRGPSSLVADLAGYFERQAAAGRFRCDPIVAARMFLGQFFSLVVGRKLWGATQPDPATVALIVDHFLNGVTP